MVTADARWEGAADEVARIPGLAEALITTHRPDENGRCLACTTPGVGTAHTRWPCGPYRLGADATRRPTPPLPEAEIAVLGFRTTARSEVASGWSLVASSNEERA